MSRPGFLNKGCTTSYHLHLANNTNQTLEIHYLLLGQVKIKSKQIMLAHQFGQEEKEWNTTLGEVLKDTYHYS